MVASPSCIRHRLSPSSLAVEVEFIDLCDALPQVLVGLTHMELARARETCAALREAVSHVWAGTRRADTRQLGLAKYNGSPLCWCDRFHELLGANRSVATRLPHLLRPLHALCELRLPGLSGIGMDVALAIAKCLPQLRALDVSSTVIQSAAVEALQPLRRLETLDLTYCAMVSYSAVLRLRAGCPALALVRRQPAWLDGHIDTPWGERHTYYPCGAFTFSGEHEAIGWVAQIRPRHTPNTLAVETRLLYADAGATENEDGRSGVLIAPHPLDDGAGSMGQDRAASQRMLLVVESLEQPEPPTTLPLQLHAATGYAVPEPDCAPLMLHGCMLSGMRLVPLAEGVRAPPPELQARLLEFCKRAASANEEQQDQQPAGQQPAGQQPAGQQPAGQQPAGQQQQQLQQQQQQQQEQQEEEGLSLWRRSAEVGALMSMERSSLPTYAASIGTAQRDLAKYFTDTARAEQAAAELWQALR